MKTHRKQVIIEPDRRVEKGVYGGWIVFSDGTGMSATTERRSKPFNYETDKQEIIHVEVEPQPPSDITEISINCFGGLTCKPEKHKLCLDEIPFSHGDKIIVPREWYDGEFCPEGRILTQADKDDNYFDVIFDRQPPETMPEELESQCKSYIVDRVIGVEERHKNKFGAPPLYPDDEIKKWFWKILTKGEG